MTDLETSATSVLPKANGVTYDAENISDDNLLTAWVPNTAKGVIGSKGTISLTMAGEQTINTLSIFNGYLKTSPIWNANARVKQLRPYIDGKPTALLNLLNRQEEQISTFTPALTPKAGKPISFTLEILSIYPGSKYKDVAITEIAFNGEGCL